MTDFDYPEPRFAEAPKRFDVDLGDGHWIEWTEYKDERCGGIITHRASTESGFCSGAFWFKGNLFGKTNPVENRPEWEFNGDYVLPTLSPSFLCHCGDHGFIRNGKWERS